MANKKFPKNKAITIPIQKYNIRKNFKKILIKEYRGIGLKMILKMQPTKLSKEYKILLKYASIQRIPQVYIDIKELEVEDKEKIPHKYRIRKINNREYINICLYYPGEWNNTMNISETIIPWISEWLYYFEFWCITGKWYGGGKHPNKKDKIKNDKN